MCVCVCAGVCMCVCVKGKRGRDYELVKGLADKKGIEEKA